MLMISDKLIDAMDQYSDDELSSLLSSSSSDTESDSASEDTSDSSSTNIDLSGLDISDSSLSADSDFHPLYQIYNEISDNDFELGKSILLQHLPTTYIELITNQMQFN